MNGMAEEPGEEEQKKHPSPPPVEFLKPGESPGPLPPRDQPPAAWVPRPEDYQQPSAWRPPARPAAAASNLPKIAGILLILSAGLGMAGALYNQFTITPAQYANMTNGTPAAVVTLLQICGLISLWSQAIAALGGVMALQRMNWKLTLVCALFSLGTLGIVYFEGTFVGLLALLVTIRARPYFLT
jgi:hypothetical protein